MIGMGTGAASAVTSGVNGLIGSGLGMLTGMNSMAGNIFNTGINAAGGALSGLANMGGGLLNSVLGFSPSLHAAGGVHAGGLDASGSIDFQGPSLGAMGRMAGSAANSVGSGLRRAAAPAMRGLNSALNYSPSFSAGGHASAGGASAGGSVGFHAPSLAQIGHSLFG